MARVPDSKPPGPPPGPRQKPGYVISQTGTRVSVEVDGVPIRNLFGVNVRFALHELPTLDLTLGLPDVRIALDDARVVVGTADLPESVARALHHNLRERFESMERCPCMAKLEQ